MTTRQQTLQLGARTTDFINQLDHTNPTDAALAAVLRSLVRGANNVEAIEAALHTHDRTTLQTQQAIRAEEAAARQHNIEATVYTVACADCQASAGHRCTTAAGRPRGLHQPHAVRRTAYENQQGKG